MKMLRLNRQKSNEPRIDELFAMIADLREFLDEDANRNDSDWNRNLSAIIDFQDDDGSFKLLDSYRIPSDARVDFCYIPTYICTAILMKAYLTDADAFTIKEKDSLSKGLEMSCARNLRGHGFEGLKGQIEALNIFMKAGLREFLDFNRELCPEFTEMIEGIISSFEEMEAQGKFLGPWNESYETEIRSVNEYFSSRNVFVYGTLMSGEGNHGYLENSDFLGRTLIDGYEMYEVGWYPAIVPGDGLIIGELYRVPKEDLPSIDTLEGEGYLYAKKCERVSLDGKTSFAYAYIYLDDVSRLKRIPAWKDEYVWYVSYGSNMLYERFLCYIRGGSFEGSRYRQPCEDPSLPLAVKAIEIPYDMYFGNESGSWEYGGVSFLDTSKKGSALGVAYLITKEQLKHVASEENGGRYPGGGQWYEDFIGLDEMDGFRVKTVTNNEIRPYNRPCSSYWKTLARGIRQNWPEMSDEDIEDYLNGCIR